MAQSRLVPSGQTSRNYNIPVELAEVGMDPHMHRLRREHTDLGTDFLVARSTASVRRTAAGEDIVVENHIVVGVYTVGADRTAAVGDTGVVDSVGDTAAAEFVGGIADA